MPSIKNNQGFGYLPILAISALVLTGTYFGYSWYSANSNQEVENKLSAVVEEDNSDKDVLQANVSSKPKIPANYNPDKLPIAWSIIDDSKPGTWQMYLFLTGQDIKKLESAVENIKKSKASFIRILPRPCIPNGNVVHKDEYDSEVTKLAEDFYQVTIKDVNTYFRQAGKEKCASELSTAKGVYVYRGLKIDEFVWAPKGVKPTPASILFSSTPATGTTSKPGVRSSSQSVAPTFNLPIDVTKMKQTQY